MDTIKEKTSIKRVLVKSFLAAIVIITLILSLIPTSVQAAKYERANTRIQVYTQYDVDAYGSLNNNWLNTSGCGWFATFHALQWLGIIDHDRESSDSTIMRIYEESNYIDTTGGAEEGISELQCLLKRKYPIFSYKLVWGNGDNLENKVKQILSDGGVVVLGGGSHFVCAVEISSDSQYVHIIDSVLTTKIPNKNYCYQYDSNKNTFVKVSSESCAVRSVSWHCNTNWQMVSNSPVTKYAGGDYWFPLSHLGDTVQIDGKDRKFQYAFALYSHSLPSPQYNYSSINSSGQVLIKNKSTGTYLNADAEQEKATVSVKSLDWSSKQLFSINGSSGLYMITTSFNNRLNLNPNSNSLSSGDKINILDMQLETSYDQHWGFEAVAGGYIIHNMNDQSLVLGLDSNNKVQIETKTGAADQIWTIETVSNVFSTINSGNYNIKNKSTGTYLNADGREQNTDISVKSKSNDDSQIFYISGSNKSYTISPEFDKTLNVNPYYTNHTISSGNKINLWSASDEENNDMHWAFEAVSGGYIIHNMRNHSLVIGLGSNNKVQVETRTGAADQIWTLEAVSDLYSVINAENYNIKNKSTGTYLNADGRKQNTDISVKSKSNDDSQIFYISGSNKAYTISPSFDKTLNVNPFYTNHVIESGNKVNLWSASDEENNDMHWAFEAVSGGYIIHNMRDQSLVIGLGSNNKVQVETRTGAADQIWILELNHTHSYGSWTKLNDTQHQRTCSCGDVQKENHTWNSGTITNAATHTSTGIKTYTCTKCNATKNETIPKTTEHSYGAWTKLNDTQHQRTCACGDVQKENHTWNSGTITNAATHTLTGIKTYTCTKCNATKNETIPKTTEHSYGAWTKLNDTQHQRTCACGDVQKENHTWDSGTVTREATSTSTGIKTYTCTKCNATKAETIPIPVQKYYIDINGYLDGKTSDSLKLNGVVYGTVDIYVDGVLVADDVVDYYTAFPVGSRYEIKDIKATAGHKYVELKKGKLSGTISSTTTDIVLVFDTLKYTVSYDANGGTGAPASQTKIYGEALALNSTKPTRSGYIFAGWSKDKNATSPTYASGAQYTANENAKLYAVWNTVAVTSVSIDTKPTKTEYWVGEELDTAGLKLKVTYSDGTTKVISAGYEVSGFSSASAGTKTVTVKYIDKSATFNVTVKPVTLTSVSIKSAPDKTEYWIGEALDLKGLALTAAYSDGSVKTISTGFTASGFNSSTAGKRTVTVSFEGQSTAFTVTVKENKLESISIKTLPNKIAYYDGEAFDPAGLTLNAVNTDGSTDTVSTGYQISGFTAGASLKTITVTYGGKSATFNVIVNEPPVTPTEAPTSTPVPTEVPTAVTTKESVTPTIEPSQPPVATATDMPEEPTAKPEVTDSPTDPVVDNTTEPEPSSAVVPTDSGTNPPSETTKSDATTLPSDNKEKKDNNNVLLLISAITGLIFIVAFVVVLIMLLKKKKKDKD